MMVSGIEKVMWRSRSQQRQFHSVQDAIKDLDDSIVQVKGSIGKRLDGKYQLQLMHMKSMTRHNSKNEFLREPSRQTVRQRTLEPYSKILYEAPVYSSFDPYKSQNTIPKSSVARDAALLPKHREDYNLGYNQRIGPSHSKLPAIVGQGDFSMHVSRDKVSFLKDQIKLLDFAANIKKEKYFSNIQKELKSLQRQEQPKFQQVDDGIPDNYFNIRVKSRNLRKNIKDTIQKNEGQNLDNF